MKDFHIECALENTKYILEEMNRLKERYNDNAYVKCVAEIAITWLSLIAENLNKAKEENR